MVDSPLPCLICRRLHHHLEASSLRLSQLVRDHQRELFREEDHPVGSLPSLHPSGHAMDIYDISWSPTSQFLVSSGTDSNIIIWGIDGTQYVRLHDHSGYIQGIDWSRDDVSIVSVANDRTARVYSYARGRVNPSLQTEDWTALAVAALRSEFRISRSVVHNKPREPGSGVACSGLPRRAQETPFCRGRN